MQTAPPAREQPTPAATHSPLRAVIFDCDGVLFDSWEANVKFYDAVLSTLGRPPLDLEGQRMAHVMSSPQLFAALFGADSVLFAQARTIAQTIDYGPFYRCMQPARGLYDVLAHLKSRYRLALATNRGVTLSGVVHHFGLAPFLDYAVGVQDVPRPKPYPDMLERCLEHFGIGPEEAVYVGDTESDYAAAQAAGVHFIAVGTATPAPLRIHELTELQPLLAAHWPEPAR
jgi:phosphoglycolate phosphatase